MKHMTAELALSALHQGIGTLTPGTSEPDPYFGPRHVPLELREWLARLRLLEGVPFTYLVSDSVLLPPETIRFFYLDRNWTDALIQGALSVGTVNSADRAQLEKLYRTVRDEIDEHERRVRMPGSEEVAQGPAATITGFLLRSRAVSGWPGLHVRAYKNARVADEEVPPPSHPDRIKLLRLERLAPAVLLALFDGVPELVHVEEPRQGVQFGVKLTQVTTTQYQATVRARNRNTSTDVEPKQEMRVFFRAGSPGVLDLRRTANEFENTAATNVGSDLDGAEFALQMIRFPYRQVFGDMDGATPMDAVFKPSVDFTLQKLEKRFVETTQALGDATRRGTSDGD